jgi:hypothetical protein
MSVCLVLTKSQQASKDYQPIHPQEELQIAAVVRAVIRKY